MPDLYTGFGVIDLRTFFEYAEIVEIFPSIA
jgi:hypothetical protein